MSIRVLLADDSDIMRKAIVGALAEDPLIEVVGQAHGFAQTIQLTNSLKPDVLLIDLHMSDEYEYPPELVRSRIANDADCILAISVWNDDDAKQLAKRLGAKLLLDKSSLYSTLLPAIRKTCAPSPKKPPLTFKKSPNPFISLRKILP
ncbi:MAG: response regulator [Acidobacteriota bacterium]|nr:response regulator [Acidobacteriota bacterium]